MESVIKFLWDSVVCFFFFQWKEKRKKERKKKVCSVFLLNCTSFYDTFDVCVCWEHNRKSKCEWKHIIKLEKTKAKTRTRPKMWKRAKQTEKEHSNEKRNHKKKIYLGLHIEFNQTIWKSICALNAMRLVQLWLWL